jgi:hypothetical protein
MVEHADVFWPHFFALAGSSSDNPVLTEHFPVPGWPDFVFAFHDNEELGRGCLLESQTDRAQPEDL